MGGASGYDPVEVEVTNEGSTESSEPDQCAAGCSTSQMRAGTVRDAAPVTAANARDAAEHV